MGMQRLLGVALVAGGLVALSSTTAIAQGTSAPTIAPPTGQPSAPPVPVEPPTEAVGQHECHVDLNRPGNLRDILSNALTRGLQIPDSRVSVFLDWEEHAYPDGESAMVATAQHFGLELDALRAAVEQYKHGNCGLEVWEDGIPGTEGQSQFDHIAVTDFARDVTLHVVLHELGHALIREFDIPVLGNEETVADAFATHYLTTYMPDRAVDVLSARVTSLLIEAADEPHDDWTGEHDHDGRRAFKIAAIAIAADPDKYAPVAAIVGMSEDDISDATDYGAEVHRSWRRVLGPLWMPADQTSTEARVEYDDDSRFVTSVCADGLADEIRGALTRFDWHSTVTVDFVDDDGGAGWNRSRRTVTVNSAYVHRFVQQGERALVTRQ